MKVVTFNLRRDLPPFAHRRLLERMDSILEFFRRQSPDLAGTQELTWDGLSLLGRLLPEYGILGEGRGGGRRGEYCAIFYRKDRLTPLKEGTFWLSSNPRRKGSRGYLALTPRICTWGIFSDKQGRHFGIFNTHLDHLSPPARRQGIQVILSRIAREKTGEVILMGDFNARPGSGALRLLSRENCRVFAQDSFTALLHRDGKPGGTYHGLIGVKKEPIDYIFVSQGLSIQKAWVDRSLYSARYPSDHYPLIACISPAGSLQG